jgi:hypothetical protein
MSRFLRGHLWVVIGVVVILASAAPVAAELGKGSAPVAPAAVEAPWVKLGVHDGVTGLSGSASDFTEIARLSLPAGRYSVTANLTVINMATSGPALSVTCKLSLGGRTHTAKSSALPVMGSDSLSLTTAGRLLVTSYAALKCQGEM